MPQKIGLSRRRFVGVGTSLGIAVLAAGCTSDDGAALNDADNPTPTDASANGGSGQTGTGEDEDSTSKGSTSVSLGELVDGGDLSMVALNMEKTTTLGQFQDAEPGNTFVVVRLAVKNTSKGFLDFSSFWQTRLKDSQNVVYDQAFGMTEFPFDGGALAPGEVSRGDVVYEVPEDATGLTMQFDFTMFDLFDFDRVTVNLEETASQMSDLMQKLGVDLLTTGQSASKNDVTVMVHGVRTESELGGYAKADKGYHYVIPDIEITNESSEPLSISTLLQMRVKSEQGFSYMADLMGTSSLNRQYSEGSELAPSESRRGELAYMVADDSGSTYFVFDFLEFGKSYKAFWEL